MGRYIKAKKPVFWTGLGLLERSKLINKPVVITEKLLIDYIRRALT